MNQAADQRELLLDALIQRFQPEYLDHRYQAELRRAGIDPATREDRSCTTSFTDADQQRSLRILTFGEVVDALLTAGRRMEHVSGGEQVSDNSPGYVGVGVDHCSIHGYEPVPADCFRVCGECGHAFETPEELLLVDRETVERLNQVEPVPEVPLMPAKTVEDVAFCPYCTHDW